MFRAPLTMSWTTSWLPQRQIVRCPDLGTGVSSISIIVLCQAEVDPDRFIRF